MVSVIRSEWYRGIRSWRFWVTVALALVLFGITMVLYANPLVPQITPRTNNIYTVTLAFLGNFFQALWPVLVPVIAVLPAGDSMAVDRRRGVDASMITRVGWTSYFGGKLVGNALVSVVAVAVAIGVAMGAEAVVYPVTLPRYLGWTFNNALSYQVKLSGVFGQVYAPAFHPHLFWAAPGLYLILAIGVALWVTAILSTLSVVAAIWIRPPILTMVAPILLYLAANVATQSFLYNGHLNPVVYAGVYLYWHPPLHSWIAVFLYWAVPGAIVVGVMGWIGIRHREWPARSVGQ